jgi:tetrahydromethanopterin S-methyltransferase subunit G
MNGSNEIIEAILTLRQATESGFLRVEKRLADHDLRFDRLEARMDTAETRVTRFEALVIQRFSQVDARFDRVDARLDDIDRRLAWVEPA